MAATMPDPADLPPGTVLTGDGMTAEKWHDSLFDPWPWTCDGIARSDEWATAAIAAGARITLPPRRRWRWPWARS